MASASGAQEVVTAESLSVVLTKRSAVVHPAVTMREDQPQFQIDRAGYLSQPFRDLRSRTGTRYCPTSCPCTVRPPGAVA